MVTLVIFTWLCGREIRRR